MDDTEYKRIVARFHRYEKTGQKLYEDKELMEKYSYKDGTLTTKFFTTTTDDGEEIDIPGGKVVVPYSRREMAFFMAHVSLSEEKNVPHLSYYYTHRVAESFFYWKDMQDDIDVYLKRCHECREKTIVTAKENIGSTLWQDDLKSLVDAPTEKKIKSSNCMHKAATEKLCLQIQMDKIPQDLQVTRQTCERPLDLARAMNETRRKLKSTRPNANPRAVLLYTKHYINLCLVRTIIHLHSQDQFINRLSRKDRRAWEVAYMHLPKAPILDPETFAVSDIDRKLEVLTSGAVASVIVPQDTAFGEQNSNTSTDDQASLSSDSSALGQFSDPTDEGQYRQIGVQTSHTLEPEDAVSARTAQVEVSDKMAEVETGDAKAEIETGNTMAEVEPGDAVAEVEPGDAVAEVEPGDAVAEVEPGDAMAEVETGDTKAEVRTGDTMTKVETSDAMTEIGTRNIGDEHRDIGADIWTVTDVYEFYAENSDEFDPISETMPGMNLTKLKANMAKVKGTILHEVDSDYSSMSLYKMMRPGINTPAILKKFFCCLFSSSSSSSSVKFMAITECFSFTTFLRPLIDLSLNEAYEEFKRIFACLPKESTVYIPASNTNLKTALDFELEQDVKMVPDECFDVYLRAVKNFPAILDYENLEHDHLGNLLNHVKHFNQEPLYANLTPRVVILKSALRDRNISISSLFKGFVA